MTDTKQEAAQVEPQAAWIALAKNVSDNPAQIEWPRDEHGITSKLKKALAEAAMSVKGNKEKEAVLIGTIMVGLAHVRKRVIKDGEVQARRLEDIRRKAEARKPLERFHTYKG